MRSWLPFALFLLLAGALFAGLRIVPGETAPDVAGRMAPPLSALDPLGETTAPAWENLRGQIVLINFFASWCAPCLAEHPALIKLAERKDIFLYGVAWNDRPETAASWLDEHGNPYRYAGRDADGRNGVAYGVTGVPESFLVAPDGKILWRSAGPLTEALMREELLPRVRRIGADAKHRITPPPSADSTPRRREKGKD